MIASGLEASERRIRERRTSTTRNLDQAADHLKRTLEAQEPLVQTILHLICSFVLLGGSVGSFPPCRLANPFPFISDSSCLSVGLSHEL